MDRYTKTQSVRLEDLVGKTLVSITGGLGDDEMCFKTSDDETYFLYHEQDCCENVEVDDIVGDLNDLIDSPIVIAREDTNVPLWEDDPTNLDGSLDMDFL